MTTRKGAGTVNNSRPDITIHVRQQTGTLLDCFNTSSPDHAAQRINRMLGYYPDAAVEIESNTESKTDIESRLTRVMTFERVMDRHADLIATIVESGRAATPAQFVDQVESASDILTQSPACATKQIEVQAAHAYLSDALASDDPAVHAVLLGKADEHLSALDPTDWL